MAQYTLTLTTEEIKTLQGLLEEALTDVPNWLQVATEKSLLEKVMIAQMQDDPDNSYERNVGIESRHGPFRSDDEIPF